MLATLLPGLRNIRAPLAAGFVILVASWLALAPVLPARSDATGTIADIYKLIDAVGTGPALAGGAFAAYLAGVISGELSKLAYIIVTGSAWLLYFLLPDRWRRIVNRPLSKAYLASPYETADRQRRKTSHPDHECRCKH